MPSKALISAAFILAAGLWSGAMVAAAPVAFTHDYGTLPGLVAPVQGGGGNMKGNYVTVVDSTSNRFHDEIAFGSAGFGTIHSLTLTLSIARAADTGEDWRVHGASGMDDGAQLGALKTGSPWSVTLTSGSVFERAVAAKSLAFWFVDVGREGRWPDEFWLYSASVTVDGVAPAPVPLPAAGLLLIGSLGGLALLRRRGAATTE